MLLNLCVLRRASGAGPGGPADRLDVTLSVSLDVAGCPRAREGFEGSSHPESSGHPQFGESWGGALSHPCMTFRGQQDEVTMLTPVGFLKHLWMNDHL